MSKKPNRTPLNSKKESFSMTNLQKDFLNILSCPKRICHGDLDELVDKNQHILICKSCGANYPVFEGIPILFPNANYSSEIHKRHWDLSNNAKGYAKKYNAYLKKQGTPWGLYTHVSELEAVKKLTKDIDLAGKVMLDCGCGNGRMLSCYPEARTKIGIDASFSLLQETQKREPDFWLVCGQLEDMPFKDCIADFSISIRVYQHLLVPEHAFAEMVRATRPNGYVALENYNKFNLKELYKRYRMLKPIDKKKSWGLSYDEYTSYKDIEKWCSENFIKPVGYSGAGWGIHFYLFEPLQFRRFAPAWLQKIVFYFFLFMERRVGALPLFSKTLEKVCFIGSLQGKPLKQNILQKTNKRIATQINKHKVYKFKKALENRNYCFTGDDLHHLRLAINWLTRAQDATADSGVSRGFSLIRDNKSNKSGWQPSYPETTGYIIPTMIDAGRILNDPKLIDRAKLMADWEIQIMFPDGAVHGGNIGEQPNKAVFDTGQVIRGLHAIYNKTGDEKYLQVANKSACWILQNENNRQGNWTESNASCVDQDTTTYNIYAIAPIVKLGLELDRLDFKELGSRVGIFTIKAQNEKGWFRHCDFRKRDDALLHTIAYTIDGLWDIGTMLNNEKFLSSAKLALEGVLSLLDNDGNIPGRLDSGWQGTVGWACLTGIAQIAVVCMKIYECEHDEKYFHSSLKMKEFLKVCQNNFDDRYGGLGAMWGSWPISGEYGRYQALNWPVKYFADLLMSIMQKEAK